MARPGLEPVRDTLALRGPNAPETSGNCGEPAPTAYGGEFGEFAHLQAFSREKRSLRRLLKIVVSPVRVRSRCWHRHVAPRIDPNRFRTPASPGQASLSASVLPAAAPDEEEEHHGPVDSVPASREAVA
jgi:hypothetical protein